MSDADKIVAAIDRLTEAVVGVDRDINELMGLINGSFVHLNHALERNRDSSTQGLANLTAAVESLRT